MYKTNNSNEKTSGALQYKTGYPIFSTPSIPFHRPARNAELPRSKFDPELFPHSAYVEIFVTFATKVPYLTFCNKM